MNKNEIINLKIIDMASTGSGVGKIDNIAVFVDGVVIGDKIKAKITKIKKNYMNAELVEIIEPSEKRGKKICAISQDCGGCQIIDMKYEEQLKIKKNIVRETLKRIGKIENVEISDTIGMEDPFYYRNKSQIPLGMENTEIVAGFYKSRTHDIVPFNNCYIQKEINNKIISIIKNHIRENNIKIYDEKTHIGNIRHIVTRISHTTGEIMIIIVTKERIIKNTEKLIKNLKLDIADFTSLIQNINSKNTNVVMGEENIVLYGKENIIEKIENLEFEIYPNVFYQINSIQMEKLYSLALEYSDVTKDDVIYDLYSGIGTISLIFAKRAKKVYGIEIVEESVNSAQKNAKRNNIENTEFISGKVEERIENIVKTREKPDIIILDPARKGAEKIVIESIIKASPRKIIYISCNPSTLARDLKLINDSNKYKIEKITPIDMFPHSLHVETVVLMSRVEK